ncbi:MAG: hypothetical protein RL693_2107 [Verrucomicrobiota bacterium]
MMAKNNNAFRACPALIRLTSLCPKSHVSTLFDHARLLTFLMLAWVQAGGISCGQPPIAPNNDANEVYQYFVSGPEGKNSGAYLWVPPDAPVIRAVMVGIHNGLPVTILQNAEVRRVCQKYGIAQILMTPNGSSDIGAMLKNLNFDITDPSRTAIYDRYLQALADLSNHPELTLAPVIPLAHSAYCSFPFDVALRDASRCLMAIPIKAGMPSVYDFYAVGGKSTKPAPELTMEGVPILFCESINQCTVPGRWKSLPIPYGSGTSGHPQTYRDDTDANPGNTYQKGNELFGWNWEMMSCHFDMMPRNYEFIARYIAAVSEARLPQPAPPVGSKPVLKKLTLDSGWLIDRFYSNYKQDTGNPYFEPSPYRDYKGPKNRALWYPNEELARMTQQTMIGESSKKFEMFTIKDKTGEPLSLAESPQVNIPNPLEYLEQDGRFTLRAHSFHEPFLVCTNSHDKGGAAGHSLANVMFPGKTVLPVSNLPVRVDLNGCPLEQVPGPDLTLKLKPHRLAPEPGGYNQFYLHLYKEENDEFAVASRNIRIEWWPNGQKKIPGLKDQKITFPSITDAPRSTRRIKLAATSSSGLSVGYFVREGPAIIEGDTLVVTQLPIKDDKPIKVTVAAWQPGLWQEDGFKAADTAYQSFFLTP